MARRPLVKLRSCLLMAAWLGVLALPSCAGAVFVANNLAAQSGAAAAGVDAQDRADLADGRLAEIRDRYGDRPPGSLSTPQLALLCDVLEKYQDLGRTGECLEALQHRVAADPGADGGRLVAAVAGKRALLLLALGQPAPALELVRGDTSTGGQYVRALALIRTDNPEPARAIAARLRLQFQPAPIYYAASLYAALGDYASARAVLDDPERRLLRDYGLSPSADVFGQSIGTAPFRLDPFDEFDFGVVSTVDYAPAANVYVEYLAALAALRTGDDAEARRRLDAILAFPAIDAYRDVLWRALQDRAEVSRRTGDLDGAIVLLRRSIDVIEQVRGSVTSEASRIAVIGDKQAPYASLVDLLVQRGQVADALVYAERAHSRVLVEMLASKHQFAADSAERREANRLLGELDRRADAVAIAAATAPTEAVRRLAQVRETESRLRESAPDVADLVTVQPIDPAAVQQSLGDGEAAIVFFPGVDVWHVFTVERSRISVHDVAAAAVSRPALAFRVAVLTGGAGSYLAQGAALYQSLLAPALAGVAAHTLVIVPSGVLSYVPFAALSDGSQFLVDRFALLVTPNLGLLTRPAPAREGGRALVIGNPLKGDPSLSLVHAEAEAQDVAAQMPGARLLIGHEATIEVFRSLTAGEAVIHFAGHGEFNAEQPLDSRLLFSTPDDQPDSFTVRQVYDLHTDAALVFLSACETGLGQLANGQDVIGLQRGFFFSGAATVVASLWSVDDASTAALVHEFYQSWRGGASAAEALRVAQNRIRQRFPEPRYWASFVVTSVGRG